MITAIQTLTLKWRQILRKWAISPQAQIYLRIARHLLSGFLMSAAGLGKHPMPLALALVCTGTGWNALLTALGAAGGYWLFWPHFGFQGSVYLASGLALALLAGQQGTLRTKPLLMGAVMGIITAATGLLFLIRFQDETPVVIYLLRMLVAVGSGWLFLTREQNRSPMIRSLAQSVWVLALAQVVPFPWLSIGFLAAGAIGVGEGFPGVALAGLALDLAQVTPVPMTAVLCLTFFLRQLPILPRWARYFLPAVVYPVVMGLCGMWDLLPLCPLAVGGLLGHALREHQEIPHRSGETGAAQVQLELTAGVFSQMQMLLLETTAAPIDETALVRRAAERACGSCPCRKTCKERAAAAELLPQILHRPLLDSHDLTVTCRKENRLLQEFHRAQEQLRSIRASREQQKECRSALLQQYQFLAEYLQDLSDQLGRKVTTTQKRYKPQISLQANRPASDSGDRCQCFPGPQCRHYVLLCDGMGSGIGAMDEGITAGVLLKRLLCAGFPPEYALRTLNSLCALRGFAGAVTVDLAQLQLDTGKVLLYKWGGAPSYLISRSGTEKIGTAGPPPGLSVTDSRETVERLSLRRGETLVLCSDGVGGEEPLCCFGESGQTLGEIAAQILELGTREGSDDATVAAIRLIPDP